MAPVMHPRSRLHSQAGFTLAELLVAVAVVGILAAIAMPFYNSYRDRAYEASAMGFMRSWPAAQELYRQQYGHYADADEQLDNPLDVVTVPDDLPYNFHIDNTSSATEGWWGRATPTRSGLRYLYIDHTGVLLASMDSPPWP